MIEVQPDRYFIGVWFVEAFPLGNTLLTAYKDKNGPWEGRARTRVYEDDKAFDSQDRKNSFAFTDTEDKHTEESIFKIIQNLAERIAKVPPSDGKVVFVPLHTDDPTKIMFQLAMQDWCHIKEETRE